TDAARLGPPARPRPSPPTPGAPRRYGSSRWSAGRAHPSPDRSVARRAPARSRRSTLVPPPRASVPAHELLGGFRPPRSRLVVREHRPVSMPRLDDRVHQRPLLLDLVRSREQRRVSEQAVEDQPFIGFGDPGPERPAVKEVHVNRAELETLPGHLGRELERDALVRLDVDHEDVGTQLLVGVVLERRVRRALELDRDGRLLPREPLARSDVERRAGPPPV